MSLCLACAPREVCGGAAPDCGGDPTGLWNIVLSSCQDQTYTPQFQVSLNDQPVEFAREVPPERTGADLCSQLVFRNGAVQGVRLEPQTVPVDSGTLTYNPDGTYQAVVRFAGTFAQHFSRACLNMHGGNPTCAEFDTALKDFVLGSSGLGEAVCSDDGGGGCDCGYRLAQDPSFTGTWTSSGGVLTHFDSFLRLPNQVDYCVRDNQLEMLGHQRGFLWDRLGLRGLVWTRTVPVAP